MTAAADLGQHMQAVARALLGEPNRHHSNGDDLRFGTNGSLSVNLTKGTYYSFEKEEGGGVLDLIKRIKGLEGEAAVDWMRGELKLDIAEPPQRKRIAAAYTYEDETGELLCQVVRFEPKDFRQRKPDSAGGWQWSVKGVRPVPYRLTELREALAHDRTVFVVEGEKDVDNLAKLNVTATCNAGGAGKWRNELNEHLRGADVVILPDNDPQAKNPDGTLCYHADGRPVFSGQDHAQDVAAKLAGVAKSVRVLELPGLPLKGDVSDWIDAGGTAEELWRLVESNAKPWAEYEIPKGESRSEATTKADGAQSPDWSRTKLINAADLCDLRFPDLTYVVPGIFPEGVTLLVSRPKLGKSWLLLQVGTAIATGVVALVSSDRPAHGDVLYLALEDNKRRLQRRLTKYFGLNRSNWPARLTIATEWKRLDQGGLEAIGAWCKSVGKPMLIVIDTLKKVRAPKRNGQNDYDADYEACEGLQKFAGEFGVAIIVSHHDRKMDAEDVFDTVSGTLGLTGGVDTIALIKRKAQGTTLHVEGRDLVESVEKAVAFDRETCRWTVLGEAADVQRSEQRARVLVALEGANEGLPTTEIVDRAGLANRAAADVLLSNMANDGQIERVTRGVYGLPGTKIAKKDKKEDEYGKTPAKDHTRPHTPASNESKAQGEADHTSDLSVRVQFLKWALTSARRLVSDIEASARAEGLLGEHQRIDTRPFRAAKMVLGVVVQREGFGPGSKVYWRLPDQGTPSDGGDGE